MEVGRPAGVDVARLHHVKSDGVDGAGHTSGDEYGQHKRFDYFVRHLHGLDPPGWADLAAAMTDDDASGQR